MPANKISFVSCGNGRSNVIIQRSKSSSLAIQIPTTIKPVPYEILDVCQHHGVPTRLLDFTENAFNAIFFAAYSSLRQTELATDIAIYALKPLQNNIVTEENLDDIFDYPQGINIHKNYYKNGNKFLSTQKGVFISYEGAEQFFWKNARWPSLEELYIQHEQTSGAIFNLKKYTLPAKYCRDLLKKLENNHISLSTLMPSYNHVAEHLMMKLDHDF